MKSFTEWPEQVVPQTGVAAGPAGLVIAMGGETYGVETGAHAAQWLCALTALAELTGVVRTWNLVDVIQALPGRPVISPPWSTIYDVAVDRVLTGNPPAEVGVELTAIEAQARHAQTFRPSALVANAVVSPVLAALNSHPIHVDLATFERLVAEQKQQRDALVPEVSAPLNGVSPRVVARSKLWATLQHDVIWREKYERWRRADIAVQRADGLAPALTAARRVGVAAVLSPVWRFHKHWTFAAVDPAVNTLPTELRPAVLASHRRVWVQFSLETPLVRWVWAEGESAEIPDGDPVERYAQQRGGFTPKVYESVLRQRLTDEEQRQAMEAVSEVYTWAAREAVKRWTSAPLVITRFGFALQLEATANLEGFLQQLHSTLVTTPRVELWRSRGAMHWSLAAGRAWGPLEPLPMQSPELWPSALQVLS